MRSRHASNPRLGPAPRRAVLRPRPAPSLTDPPSARRAVALLDASVGDFGGHPFFGATSLITKTPRPWDVISLTPSNMLVLSAKQFDGFLKRVPDFKQRLTDFTAARARQWELQMPMKLRRAPDAVAHRSGGAPGSTAQLGDGGREIGDEDLEAIILIQASMRGTLTRKAICRDAQAMQWRQAYEADPPAPAS